MYRCILVPLDGSDEADAALPWAATLPGETVRLLRVEPVGEGELPAPDFGPAAATLAETGRTVEQMVVRGDPAEEIVRAAEEADLIVMGTRARGAGGRRIYGSVADRVARHAPAPTLLVRAGGRPVGAAPPARLLVPLDCSPAADRAAPVAAALARALGIAVHAVVVGEPDDPPTKPTTGGVSRLTRDRADAHLATLASTIGADGCALSSEVRQGDPADEILATIQPGDLVVMTTHGGGGAQRWAIGAVAERVLRHAPVAVMLVRTDKASHAPA